MVRKDIHGPYDSDWGNRDIHGPMRLGEQGPQAEKQEIPVLHLLAVHFDISYVVLEDGRDVDLWKLVFAEDDEEAGLPTGTITYNHQLLSDCSHGRTWQARGSGDLRRGKPVNLKTLS